jgi:hypothetical protein
MQALMDMGWDCSVLQYENLKAFLDDVTRKFGILHVKVFSAMEAQLFKGSQP